MTARLPIALALTPPDERYAEPSLRGTVIAAFVIIGAFCLAAFGWSLFAHLDSAVIARGVVVVDSQRKTVQHLEGGILRELLVQEGDHVRVGQPVALLDTTQSDAQLGQITSQQIGVQARIARLQAERMDRRTLEFPSALLERRADPIVADAIGAQRQMFEARWRAYDSSLEIIRKRIAQQRELIAAATSQLATVERRLQLTEEESHNVSYLLARGYERRPRYLELQRAIEELKEKQGTLRGAIAQARELIASSEAEIANLGDSRHSEVARDLEDARAQDADIAERLRAARDIRQRKQIVAPQDGVVVDLRLVTPGGVILPGQPLMDIVPSDDDLIIETRVHPDDIETVHVGLPAQIELLAYKRSTTPSLDGEVTYVSADMLSDPRNGESYFLARLKLLKDSLARAPEVVPSPGMPAEALIVTGERRAIDYFLAPLLSRLRRSFREE